MKKFGLALVLWTLTQAASAAPSKAELIQERQAYQNKLSILLAQTDMRAAGEKNFFASLNRTIGLPYGLYHYYLDDAEEAREKTHYKYEYMATNRPFYLLTIPLGTAVGLITAGGSMALAGMQKFDPEITDCQLKIKAIDEQLASM